MTDRPWATTLAGLGARRFTGQLTIQADARQYRIVFDRGAVIGATSPLASDSAARVALLHHMIEPAQLAELTRRIAAAPERDELEVLAEAARLTRDQALRLRRKVVLQRAARTFSIDEGELVTSSSIDVSIPSGLAVDVRSVIYLGARMNLSVPRLGSELRRLGVRFVLRPDALGELERFGFTGAEQPILDALRAGTSVAELEARHRDLDPRTIRAVIYSLVACALCTGDAPPRSPAAPPSGAYSRTRTGRDVVATRTPARGSSALAARTSAPRPSDPRAFRQTTLGSPALARTPPPLGTSSLKRGFSPGSPALGRTPTPARATVLGRAPTARGLPVVARTPAPAGLLRGKPPETAAPASEPLAAAREAYRRGQARLRAENLEDAIADLTRAVELAPGESDYAAALAWARFCHAPDKQPLAHATRDALARAIRRSQTPEVARFYLGRVERMLGRDREALRHFHELLEAQPRHADAAAEIRAIVARMASERGVLGRKR